MERRILHLDLDTFFVSVERLMDKSLIGKPVIVGGDGNRGVVSTCSYEARKFGVHSGMPGMTAKKMCPQAIFVHGHSKLYSQFSKQVTSIIAQSAPLMEKASIDEHYVDLSGMDKYFDSFKWAKAMRKRIIRETKLPISFGLSENKTVAKMATTASKPNGELFIPKDKIKAFLFPMDIRKIPGIGIQTYKKIHGLGISTIEDLATASPEYLQAKLGKHGLSLWKKANGIDHSAVIPYRERKSMSSERTFEKDYTDVNYLKRKIILLAENLCHDLRNKGKLCSIVSVKVRYSDFSTFSMQKHIDYTCMDSNIIHNVLLLFDKLYKPGFKVRLIGVRLAGLVYGAEQLSLFDNSETQMHLLAALDSIKNKYGKKAVGRAGGFRYKQNKEIEYENYYLPFGSEHKDEM